MADYPAVKPKFLSGDTPLLNEDGSTIASLEHYWSWAYSDLLGNTERGALAEYFVACAIGIQHKERITWNKYDLLSNEGISIEVKTSGYLQTWAQNKLSAIVFGIQPTFGWDSESNMYDTEQKRQADIYIFCVHKHTDQETVNPLDVRQWDFYVLPTKILNERVGQQKTISLQRLLKIGAVKCGYTSLHKTILSYNSK